MFVETELCANRTFCEPFGMPVAQYLTQWSGDFGAERRVITATRVCARNLQPLNVEDLLQILCCSPSAVARVFGTASHADKHHALADRAQLQPIPCAIRSDPIGAIAQLRSKQRRLGRMEGRGTKRNHRVINSPPAAVTDLCGQWREGCCALLLVLWHVPPYMVEAISSVRICFALRTVSAPID